MLSWFLVAFAEENFEQNA